MAAAPQDTPATRFRARQREWRSRTQRFYARHAQVEPHAKMLVGWLFDEAERIPGPMRQYAFTSISDPFVFVRMNADPGASKPWSWHAPSHDVDGRGFYELWALRFDLPVCDAAEQVWVVIRAAGGGA